MRRERGRWYGPARIVTVEGLRVIWLMRANKLIRASPEQLRPASFREWKQVATSEEAGGGPVDWLKRTTHEDFFDLGSEIPTGDDLLIDGNVDTSSLPEPEQPPSVPSDDYSPSEPAADPEAGDGLNAPVPDDGDFNSEDDLLFGDTVEPIRGLGAKFWEIDVIPGNLFEGEPLFQGLVGNNTAQDAPGDSIGLLASEQCKKRVEVRLKDLDDEEQRLFATAKHKELKAWLRHNTVRKVSQGQIPEHALMRCRWLINWKTPSGDEKPHELSASGMKAKARLIIIGYEDPDIDEVCFLVCTQGLVIRSNAMVC